MERKPSKKKTRLEKGEASFNYLLRKYKSNAAKRGILFYLNEDQFRRMVSSDCYYCGVEPEQKAHGPLSSRKFNGNFTYNGIDRMDNNKGYFFTNCVACCMRCNRAKNSMGAEEFLIWVSRVYENQLKIDEKDV